MSGRTIKDRLEDLSIELVGAALVALIGWAFFQLVDQLALPSWVVILLSVAVAFALMVGVGYIRRTRALRATQAHIQTLTAQISDLGKALAETRKSLYELRDTSRRVASQLVTGREPDGMSYVATYQVDPDGHDLIITDWTVAFAEGREGTVFFVEEWSSYPSPTKVACTCEPIDDESSVIPVEMEDEPAHQKVAVFLAPPVGPDGRQVRVRHSWPDLWKGLRENGRDYIEVSARPGLKAAKILIEIPTKLGAFEWEKNFDKNMKLGRSLKDGKQILELSVDVAIAGQHYIANLRKSENGDF
jgi:hypothetical protein